MVRRSLKEQPRLQAERRGEMDLKFAKWQVSRWRIFLYRLEAEIGGSAERQARREQEPGHCKRKRNGRGGRSRTAIESMVETPSVRLGGVDCTYTILKNTSSSSG